MQMSVKFKIGAWPTFSTSSW